jgi:hypothetical protein
MFAERRKAFPGWVTKPRWAEHGCGQDGGMPRDETVITPYQLVRFSAPSAAERRH